MDGKQQKLAAYGEIQSSLEGLLEGCGLPWESALVSLIALLKTQLTDLSWVGFYREVDGHLWIGAYQGKLACTHLKPGQGVCGQSLLKRVSIVVDDVQEFPGHVYCDPAARSEIVLPVYHSGILVGVLDLDSPVAARFDTMDQANLEALLKLIEPLSERVIL